MRVRLGLNAVSFLALVGLVVVAPFLVSDFHSSDLAFVGAFFIALVGLDVLVGYSGQISLAHGAFMAIGGYTSAILVADHGWRDIATIPIAGLVAGAAGALVGIPALRLSGLYLALVTFGIAVSAFYAGVGGSLYAIGTAFVNPSTFQITTSIFLVVALVVGGLGTLSGLTAGALFIYYVPRYASSIFHFVERVFGFDANEQAPGVPSLVLGVALILLMLILPTGVGGLLRRLVAPLTSRLYSRS